MGLGGIGLEQPSRLTECAARSQCGRSARSSPQPGGCGGGAGDSDGQDRLGQLHVVGGQARQLATDVAQCGFQVRTADVALAGDEAGGVVARFEDDLVVAEGIGDVEVALEVMPVARTRVSVVTTKLLANALEAQASRAAAPIRRRRFM